ncbi:hypothetical protein [Aquimarina aquimarini]|uniref:hypothetical protein n=1 Tax=Aquimarina aquimarini TaxID=1191734 RepID=UPI001F33EB14|nr:hypothetical protein [Aquimarina aquimarini]
MKTYCITIITICICITACDSTKQFVTNDNLCQENDPIFIITKEEMTFDIDKYKKQLEKGEDIVVEDNDNYNSTIYQWEHNNTIVNKQTNKQTNKQKHIGYYPNGKVWYTRFSHSKYNIYFRKEIVYDPQGNITKVIDYRQADKYPICYKEALKITEDLKRKRDSIFAITRDSLVTDVKKTYVWKVFIDEPQDPEVTQHAKSWCYVINAQTGKVIKKVKVTANPG